MLLKKCFYFWVSILMAGLVVACDSEGEDYPYGPRGEGDIEALVLNEGLINTNTGSVSVLYKDGTVVPDIFRDVNSRPMGDVAQSITKINGKYFVAMDNSKKIEIMEPVTFRSLGTILYTQAGYPRQIVPISETEAIVSDLNRQLVRIRTVEPYGEPLEYISIPRWVEYMVVVRNKVFGMTAGGLYVFDTDNIRKEAARVIKEVRNDEVTKTCRMLVDKYDNIWILMNEKNGSKYSNIVLTCVNPVTEKVVTSYRLPLGNKEKPRPGEVVDVINYNRTDIDPTLTWIYFNVKTGVSNTSGNGVLLQQSVYRMNVDTGKFELYRNLPGANMMYGFSVSPWGDVYLCDCLDYSAQRGFIRKYMKDGSVLSYRVGVYPGQVYFPKV